MQNFRQDFSTIHEFNPENTKQIRMRGFRELWRSVLLEILKSELFDQEILEKVNSIRDEISYIHHYKCDIKECLCKSRNSFVSELISGCDYDNERNLRKLYVIKLLFREKIINHKMIRNDTLANLFLDIDQGWKFRKSLINFLLHEADNSNEGNKILERFLNLKVSDSNILNLVVSINNAEDSYQYFKFFYEKGAKLEKCNLLLLNYAIINPKYLKILKYLIGTFDHTNLPKDITDLIIKYFLNFNICDDNICSFENGVITLCEVPLIILVLRRYFDSDNTEVLNNLRELIEIALNHGYDTSLKDDEEKDLIDYFTDDKYRKFMPDRLKSIVLQRQSNH